MKLMPPFRVCLAACLVLALPPVALHGASPRDELLRLVPDDVGVCVVLQNLRGHTAALADSPFAAQVMTSFVGDIVRNSPELKKLKEADKVLKEQLGTDWAQLRDDILGDAVVMAFQPSPGKPGEEPALFLIRARDAAFLQKLVDRLNEVQKKAGDLKELEARDHAGIKFFRRVEGTKPAYFYLIRDNVLAVANQETMLRQVIDLEKKAPAAHSATPALARQLNELATETPLFSLWIRPRAFDADLEKKAAEAKGADAAFLKNFLVYWKAVDGLALFASPQQQFEVRLAVKARTNALPASARKFFAGLGQPSDLWGAIPNDALFGVAARLDFAALPEMIGEFLPDDARKAMRDALNHSPWPPLDKIAREVLPRLGPDLGFCIIAPPAGDKDWFPQAFAALRIQPGSDDEPVEQTLMDGLNFLARVAESDYNRKNADRVTLKTVVQDRVGVRYFVNDKRFPPGLQPAYALKAGYLLFATSPDVVKRFAPSAVKPEGEVPILRVSLVAWQGFIKERREELVGVLADKDQMTKAEAGRRLDGVLAGLQFFHGVEITQRPGDGHAVVTARIRTAQPLRK